METRYLYFPYARVPEIPASWSAVGCRNLFGDLNFVASFASCILTFNKHCFVSHQKNFWQWFSSKVLTTFGYNIFLGEPLSNDNAEFLVASALVAAWIPIFPDPFYHEERVSFWVWLQREIYELFYGEKAKAVLGLE